MTQIELLLQLKAALVKLVSLLTILSSMTIPSQKLGGVSAPIPGVKFLPGKYEYVDSLGKKSVLDLTSVEAEKLYNYYRTESKDKTGSLRYIMPTDNAKFSITDTLTSLGIK